MANHLVAQLRKRREVWVDVGDGRRIKFLRPLEAEHKKLLKFDGKGTATEWAVDVAEVCLFVEDWSGFTEANILGPAIGSDQIVPFDKELFAEMVSDRSEWIAKVARAILDSVIDHLLAKGDVAKNSEAGSTSVPASGSTESSPATTSTTT